MNIFDEACDILQQNRLALSSGKNRFNAYDHAIRHPSLNATPRGIALAKLLELASKAGGAEKPHTDVIDGGKMEGNKPLEVLFGSPHYEFPDEPMIARVRALQEKFTNGWVRVSDNELRVFDTEDQDVGDAVFDLAAIIGVDRPYSIMFDVSGLPPEYGPWRVDGLAIKDEIYVRDNERRAEGLDTTALDQCWKDGPVGIGLQQKGFEYIASVMGIEPKVMPVEKSQAPELVTDPEGRHVEGRQRELVDAGQEL